VKHIKRLSIIVIIITFVLFTLAFLPKPQFEKENPFKSNGKPLVIAHSGGMKYPDNTLKNFDFAYQLGVDVLEMDVMMTLDGVLVLLHGENVTGNTRSHSNCDTVVWKETYAYLLNTCNFGYLFQDALGNYPYQDLTSEEWISEKVHLATLTEVFEAYGNTILYNIEIKADSDAPRIETADALYTLIDAFNLQDYVLVAVAFDDISQHLVSNYPDLYVSTSYGSAQSMIIGIYSLTSIFQSRPKFAAVQVPTSYHLPVINTLRLDTRHLIRTLNQHNMAMHYWTVNDEKTMRHLISLGADGIITDDIELLMSILNE